MESSSRATRRLAGLETGRRPQPHPDLPSRRDDTQRRGYVRGGRRMRHRSPHVATACRRKPSFIIRAHATTSHKVKPGTRAHPEHIPERTDRKRCAKHRRMLLAIALVLHDLLILRTVNQALPRAEPSRAEPARHHTKPEVRRLCPTNSIFNAPGSGSSVSVT
jgi:hypothetical protein